METEQESLHTERTWTRGGGEETELGTLNFGMVRGGGEETVLELKLKLGHDSRYHGPGEEERRRSRMSVYSSSTTEGRSALRLRAELSETYGEEER